jgi:hypothetical protein
VTTIKSRSARAQMHEFFRCIVVAQVPHKRFELLEAHLSLV